MITVRPPSPPLLLLISDSNHSTRSYSYRSAAIHIRNRRRDKPLSVAAAGSGVDGFTESSGYLFELSDFEANTPIDYNNSKIAAIYRRKPFLVIRRLLQIGSTLGKWFAIRYIDGLTEKSELMFEARAAELRKILVQLGPAYIKIAQAISSRSDLVPPSYLKELTLLQDRITPFSNDDAFKTIEKELGSPIDEIFSEISPDPVAAASLGQVYQARIRTGGQLVAVKVQRPGVQAAISLDILILRYIAGLIKRAGKFNTDLQAVVDEWASSLFREMDYNNEAKNGKKFRELYGSLKDVMVPKMYEELTTRRVLTMQWIEGQKLSDVKDLYMVEVGVYCSFNQIFEYGFYHADPHPGNLFRTTDGKLAYLDFGMMGEFKEELRNGFIEACLHLVNRDYDSLAKDFITLGLIPAAADKDAVTKALTGVFQNAVAKGIRNISFGDLLVNLGTTMYKFKFQIPSYFSLVIRSLAVLEGVAIGINPEYKVLGSTYPWMARKVLTDSSPQLQSTLQTLLYEDGIFRVDRLESLVSESLRARTEKALVKSEKEEEEFNSSKVVFKEILSFTLTEKGAFFREIILQELAKGMDAIGVATLDSSSMTKEDMANLGILNRILKLLSGLQNNDTEIEVVTEAKANGILDQFGSVQEVLPLLSVIPELNPEVQQQLFRLPADLAGKLVSRAAARTIRRIFL